MECKRIYRRHNDTQTFNEHDAMMAMKEKEIQSKDKRRRPLFYKYIDGN